MRRMFPLVVLLLFASFSIVRGQPTQAADLLIYNVWVRPTAAAPAEGATPELPPPGTVTSAYMTIENTGLIDVRLIAIDDDFAKMSMIHETTIDDAGVARMRMVGTLDIQAGATVQLAPAGYHAMLMNVTRDLYPGEAEKLALTFEDADGAIFVLPVGALVTDFPPEESSMIAANTAAISGTDETMLILLLDNRDTADDMLVSVESSLGAVTLLDDATRAIQPFTPQPVPRSVGAPFETGWLVMLADASQTPPEAFPLTLTFQSGKVITVAVPVITGEAE